MCGQGTLESQGTGMGSLPSLCQESTVLLGVHGSSPTVHLSCPSHPVCLLPRSIFPPALVLLPQPGTLSHSLCRGPLPFSAVCSETTSSPKSALTLPLTSAHTPHISLADTPVFFLSRTHLQDTVYLCDCLITPPSLPDSKLAMALELPGNCHKVAQRGLG